MRSLRSWLKSLSEREIFFYSTGLWFAVLFTFIFAILLLFPNGAYGYSECDAFQDGFKAGYCSEIYTRYPTQITCLPPLPPPCIEGRYMGDTELAYSVGFKRGEAEAAQWK